MPVNNQVAHAFATKVAGPPVSYSVQRADGCVLSYDPASPGVYLVTLATGFGGPAKNLKVTPNVESATPLLVNIEWVNQTQIRIKTFDKTAAATDCDAIWVTIEVVPRVS